MFKHFDLPREDFESKPKEDLQRILESAKKDLASQQRKKEMAEEHSEDGIVPPHIQQTILRNCNEKIRSLLERITQIETAITNMDLQASPKAI